MQEPSKSRKWKNTIIPVFLILVVMTGLIVYVSTHPLSFALPLDNGGWMSSYWAGTGINETASAGFSVWNEGAAPLTVEKVEVRFTDNETELVEVNFVKVLLHQGVGSYRGTPEQNGLVTYPVAGYTIEPRQEAQLYVSIRANTIGYHSATRIIFTYTYLAIRYKFTYNIEDYFTLEVKSL